MYTSYILLFLDQTPEEIERTKQFALEVVDLLKHNPQCRMAFNKFIPAYHHHFGRQCRVADYGFTKLTDLFECIFQVVEVRTFVFTTSSMSICVLVWSLAGFSSHMHLLSSLRKFHVILIVIESPLGYLLRYFIIAFREIDRNL